MNKIILKNISTLYKQENYQTAIGVYNHAIRMFPKVPAYAFFLNITIICS